MDEPPKLEPISMKVGRDPVVMPFRRWRVVVGGSEYISNKSECSGWDAVSC